MKIGIHGQNTSLLIKDQEAGRRLAEDLSYKLKPPKGISVSLSRTSTRIGTVFLIKAF